MAGPAQIGALHVFLGLDSAQFSAGLAKAQNGMARFSKSAGIGLAAVATAAAASTVALGVAVKGAIDNADKMGETAQSIGVSVEALSSLGYAAKLSGSDLETLTVGLRKLSQGMLSVAEGSGGPLTSAFQMLGVSVTDTEGKLRSSDAVLIDIAEKFSRMEDGALKTATAVRLFGRSGAELIPFLNQGRDGIASLTAEADRLGITLSGSTAEAAGRFNDSMDRLGALWEGMINKIMTGVVPGLDALAASLTNTAMDFGGIQLAVDAAIWVFKQFMQFLAETKAYLDVLAVTLDVVVRAFQQMEQGNASGALQALSQTAASTDAIFAGLKTTIDEIWNGTSQGGPGASGTNSIIPDIAEIQAAEQAMKKLADEGQRVFEATRTPAEALSLEIENLNKLLNAGAIDWDTYNRAVLQAQDEFSRAEMAGNRFASSIADGLANIFEGVIDGSKSATQSVIELIKSLGTMALQQGFQALVGGVMGGASSGGGLGGILSSIFGGGGGAGGPLRLGFNLPGFANGGSGIMGGVGGPDSQLFMARVTPGEPFAFGDDAVNGMGGGLSIGQISVDARGAQRGVGEEVARALADFSKNELPNRVQQISKNPLRR